MNPEDFLVLAERLAAGPDEASLRSAISRAYYAIFHMVLDDLGPIVEIPRDAAGHRILGRCLRNCGLPQAVTLAQTLDTLRDSRNVCDYRLDLAGPSPPTVAMRVTSARQFVTDYLALPRPALHDGVRAYRDRVGGW